MKIEINKNSVIKSGNSILEYSKDFERCIKKFLHIIESINTAWEGEDSLKYVNTMKDKYINVLEELNDYISKYGTYLKKVPETYEILDETFCSKNIDV